MTETENMTGTAQEVGSENSISSPLNELFYAGFWARFLAYFLDFLILLIPGMILVSLGLGFAGGFVIGFLYKPFLESSFVQATIGKRIVGMKVVGNGGTRLTFKAAVIRWLVSTVCLLFFCIGHLIQPFTKMRQTLHDIIAECYVVEGRVELPEGKTLFDCWVEQFKKIFNN